MVEIYHGFSVKLLLSLCWKYFENRSALGQVRGKSI